jgi:hypothetical protein
MELKLVDIKGVFLGRSPKHKSLFIMYSKKAENKKVENKSELSKAEELGGYLHTEIIRQMELERCRQEAIEQGEIRQARLRARTDADRLFREFVEALSSNVENINTLNSELNIVKAEITKIQQYSLVGYKIFEPAEAVQPFYLAKLEDFMVKINKKLDILIAIRDRDLNQAKNIFNSRKYSELPPLLRLKAIEKELEILNSSNVYLGNLSLSVRQCYKQILEKNIPVLRQAISTATVVFEEFRNKQLEGQPIAARIRILKARL